MLYEIICLVAGERRALKVVAANAAAAVVSAQTQATGAFELLAVFPDNDERAAAAEAAGSR